MKRTWDSQLYVPVPILGKTCKWRISTLYNLSVVLIKWQSF